MADTVAYEQRDTTDATGYASLCAAFQATAARVPERVALRTLGGTVSITWREYAERVTRFAAGLAGLGVGRGDVVALMLGNRPEFHVVDTAALHLGATTVSVYNTLPTDDIRYVLEDSGASVVITEPAFVAGLAAAIPGTAVQQIALVEGTADGALPPEQLLASAPADFDFDAAWRAVGHDDVAVLIYTSGTTGPPKGVELTHGALLGNLQGMHAAIGTVDGARVVSFLPMAHIAERTFSHYRSMTYGFTTTCCPEPRLVPQYLLDVRPTYFFSPPRLFEKFRAGALAALAADEDQERAAAAKAVIEAAVREVQLDQAGEPVPAELREQAAQARATVGKAILARFGLDEVIVALTGSAPVPPDLIGFFHALGLPTLEAWGLSECGAFGTFNRPDDYRLGTCGKPLPGIEIRLEEDGEILLRSPWIMRGYRGKPEMTAEAIDPEGWLHTGDVGTMDDDGFLKIVDRKKELIINAAGKNMSPANIEGKMKDAHPLIGQVCVFGDGRPFNVALIALDPDAASAYAAKLGREGAPLAELTQTDEVAAAVAAGVAAANEKLARVEQVKYYELLGEEWLPGGDELTPTMKLKRKPIAAKYADKVDALYTGAEVRA